MTSLCQAARSRLVSFKQDNILYTSQSQGDWRPADLQECRPVVAMRRGKPVDRMQAENRLKEWRERRGVSAAALARKVGVSRQTIYAMEAGSYVPNTTTALRLAAALETTVEQIFRLGEAVSSRPKPLVAEVLRPPEWSAEQPVRLCRVGMRHVAVPALPETAHLSMADGIAVRPHSRSRALVECFPETETAEQGVLLAGCDPSFSLLQHLYQRSCRAELVVAYCSSQQALEWLRQGRIHMAGSHLRDPRSGLYNLPLVKRLFPRGGYRVVTFAVWEQGLVVRRGNPKNIRSVADLVRPGVTIVNRERGAGSRQLLDELLRRAGIAPGCVRGYENCSAGHLAAALAVSRGEADCCVATRSAAKAFGLHFLPLAEERYDFVTLERYAELPALQKLFDLLNRATLRRRLELLAGYDTSHTGELLA